MKVAVVDYGMSNLGSVTRVLEELGVTPFLASTPERLRHADRMILPGVGSFGDGMACLTAKGLDHSIREQVVAGKPILGICLGMQLLATAGTEGGDWPGLGLVPGVVRRLDALGCNLRIPHVGWNDIKLSAGSRDLFAGIPDGTDFYFVHSFAFEVTHTASAAATVVYGAPLCAAVVDNNVFGTQFHPEKSSRAGFRLLKNFLEYRPC